MFELACVLGLKKKRVVERGRSPTPPGGLGGAEPPMYSLSRREKALKRDCGVLIVAIITIIKEK